VTDPHGHGSRFHGITSASLSDGSAFTTSIIRCRVSSSIALAAFSKINPTMYVACRFVSRSFSALKPRALKEVVATMSSEELKSGEPRFSAKTVSNYAQVVKMVVASAIDENGEAIFPVKWNHDFIDLPEIADQNTPVFTAGEVTTIIKKAEHQDAVLYALLAGSGLRAGELFALTVDDLDGFVLRVRQSNWNGVLQSPKTKNGVPAFAYAASFCVTTSVALRSANDIITRVIPLMIMLTPTSVPIAHTELDGHCA
jgi:hypothetical protein